MNKAELIDAIAERAALSKADAGKALDATVAALTEALKQGDTVTLVGFGSFYVGERAACPEQRRRRGHPYEHRWRRAAKCRRTYICRARRWRWWRLSR